MATLKLYVWKGVLRDYSSGVMFALAHSAKEARQVIEKEFRRVRRGGEMTPDEKRDLAGRPEVVRSPRGFYEYGGG